MKRVFQSLEATSAFAAIKPVSGSCAGLCEMLGMFCFCSSLSARQCLLYLKSFTLSKISQGRCVWEWQKFRHLLTLRSPGERFLFVFAVSQRGPRARCGEGNSRRIPLRQRGLGTLRAAVPSLTSVLGK